MSLLHQIQEEIVQEGSDLGSVLLKFRLLASRLGSNLLEEWVRYESEGYPRETDVPPYRIVGASYHDTFSGPFGSGINNAPIPTHLVKKYAGDKWVNIEIRESIAAIDGLVKSSADEDGTIYKGSNWFTRERAGRVTDDGEVLKGSSWWNEERVGKIEND